MKIFLRLVSYVKPYHHFIPEYLIHSIFSILFGLMNYTMLIPLLNILFDIMPQAPVIKPEKFVLSIQYLNQYFQYLLQTISAEKGKIYTLILISVIIFVCIFISNVFKYLSFRVTARLKIRLIQNLRNVMFERLIYQDLSFHYKHKKGNLISVLMNDVQELENGVGNTIQNLLRAPLVIIFYLVVLFYISFKLTIFTLIFFPISGFIISNVIKRLKKKGHFSQEFLGKLLSFAEEFFSGIKIIKAFTAQEHIINVFKNINKKLSLISKSNFNQREMASPLLEFMGVSIMLILVVFGGYLILGKQSNVLTGSMFIAYLAIYSQMLPPLKDLTNCLSFIPKAVASGERIFNFLDEPLTIKEEQTKDLKINFNDKIEFKNVKFKYGQNWILNDISFEIKKGETVALVGQSGSGKTTIADLLFRFYDIQKGKILIDGQDIKKIPQKVLQNNIGIVTQEPFLFNDNVFNNITFGTTKQGSNKEDEVKRVAKIAYSDSFISKLEHGYYTNIGERGMKLSGGQRQRLTIARALYKDPTILVLDEATASLDSELELNVQQALQNAMKNRTCIVIAHRLSTIKNADKIIVLEKGEVLEVGTHKELIQKKGVYSKFIKMQETK